MDVFTPKAGANGSAVVLVVSGGYFSSHDSVNPVFLQPLLNRGYTVFSVVHGSQPRYTVSEIVVDVNRAIRFIRHHAKDYSIDPNRIGITGASAGGHLSLMMGTNGDLGDPKAKDPVDRESSRVQAVACFFPPTDFLNFGAAGRELIHAKDHGRTFRPAFDYHELDQAENLWVPVTDDRKLREIARNQLAGLARLGRRRPRLDLPRRRRHARPAPAVGDDRRETERRGGSKRSWSSRTGGGPRLADHGPRHGRLRRLVRCAPESGEVTEPDWRGFASLTHRPSGRLFRWLRAWSPRSSRPGRYGSWPSTGWPCAGRRSGFPRDWSA